MGCDIHIIYQCVGNKQKREDKLSNLFNNKSDKISDEWEYITNGVELKDMWASDMQFSYENRNYYWFGRMSEVRGYGPRITIEGFPSDVKKTYIENHYGTYFGDHSFSHVYLDTLLNEKWTEDDKIYMSTFINEDIPRMKEYCDKNHLKPNEFRLLIGYDS